MIALHYPASPLAYRIEADDHGNASVFFLHPRGEMRLSLHSKCSGEHSTEAAREAAEAVEWALRIG